jgi:hypothetical protein
MCEAKYRVFHFSSNAFTFGILNKLTLIYKLFEVMQHHQKVSSLFAFAPKLQKWKLTHPASIPTN